MKQGQIEAIKRFDRAITVAFGDGLRNEERFRTLYDSVKSPNESDSLPPYGGDRCAIMLMLYLRKQMRKCGLAPNEPLEPGGKDFHQFRTECLGNTVAFKYRFPETWAYDCEIRNPNDRYTEDGWNYQIVRISIEPDQDREKKKTEWLDTKDGILTHFYYNELDHYLTHLVGVIRGCGSVQNKRFEAGYTTFEREIEENNQSNPSAEAPERELHGSL